MKTKWYRKLQINTEIAETIGTAPGTWEALAASKIASDMVKDVADFLGVPEAIITGVLYQPTQPPRSEY